MKVYPRDGSVLDLRPGEFKRLLDLGCLTEDEIRAYGENLMDLQELDRIWKEARAEKEFTGQRKALSWLDETVGGGSRALAYGDGIKLGYRGALEIVNCYVKAGSSVAKDIAEQIEVKLRELDAT